MKILSLLFLCFTLNAYSSQTVIDENKLAMVTLHTEKIISSKRVYLAADFEASHKSGLISCDLTVEHKNGRFAGKTFHLKEETTLLPEEKIPFNLGLFPEYFHASGLDVKSKLICRRIDFFENKTKKSSIKLTEKNEVPETQVCCRLNTLKTICHTEPGAGIDVNYTEFQSITSTDNLSPCYPEK